MSGDSAPVAVVCTAADCAVVARCAVSSACSRRLMSRSSVRRVSGRLILVRGAPGRCDGQLDLFLARVVARGDDGGGVADLVGPEDGFEVGVRGALLAEAGRADAQSANVYLTVHTTPPRTSTPSRST
ncbi:hypothetical protein OG787_39175 [Streptomyces sp. NBC_00075]|uniref:hypothetical protein n=1 Tax=Streptomyces sp. NBC_00075 TaxID=2975641 RepID=UPI00324C47F2